MDTKRIVSGAIVGISVLLILLIPSEIVVNIILAIIAIVAIHEYLNAISKICKPIKWISYLSCIIVAIVGLIPEQYINFILMFEMPILLLLMFAQVIATDMKTTFKDMVYTLLGIAYIQTFMMFLSLINGMHNGRILFVYLLIAAFGTDVFAYSIGCRIGKHKFSKVSPKKSIEGCIAGTLGAVLIGVIFTVILNQAFSYNYSYLVVISAGIAFSLIGQIGDFAASCIKRYVDIKDYSNLLPGHGGMLDRIDSVLFIAPFAYMLFTIL